MELLIHPALERLEPGDPVNIWGPGIGRFVALKISGISDIKKRRAGRFYRIEVVHSVLLTHASYG